MWIFLEDRFQYIFPMSTPHMFANAFNTKLVFDERGFVDIREDNRDDLTRQPTPTSRKRLLGLNISNQDNLEDKTIDLQETIL